MSGLFVQYPQGGGGAGGIPTYVNVAAFPPSAADGATAIALDTDDLFIYNAATSTWVLVGGPGSAFYPINLGSTSQVTGVLQSGNGGTGTSTNWTSGSVIFAGGSSSFTQDNSNFFWNDSATRLGIGTNAPSSDLTFGGDVSRSIGLIRNSTTNGSLLTLIAGAAALGGTDLNGGTLQFRSGVSTGLGTSAITFLVYSPATVTGSTDNILVTKMLLNSTGLGIGTTGPGAALDVAGTRLGLPGAGGSQVEVRGIAFTDTSTAANGTAATFVGSRFNLPTLTSSNSNVTTTNASTITISGGVNAGNNNNLTNSSALRLTGGAVIGTVTNYYQLFISGAGTGGVNNYAASIAGLVGMGGVLDPQTNLEITSASKTVSSSEQLCLRSQRNAIVSGDLVGGISYKSNDTNLTAPGIVVALTSAVAEAIHTASVLDTGLAFYTTKTLVMSESMRISGAGFVGIGKTSPTVPLDLRGQFNINGSTSGFFGLKAADAAGGTVYTWPTTAGTAGQFMQSNGVGSLSFVSVPAPSLVGSVSLVNQVVGNLPLSQTSGSISLTTQVVGILPIVRGGTGTSSFTNGSIPYASSTGTLAESNPGLVWDQTNSVLRSNKIFAPSIALGSTTLTSSTGGATYTLTFPGTLGSASQILVNDGAGRLSWQTGLYNAPTITTFTIGTGSGSYTPPVGCKYFFVRAVGGGGGGGGVATAATSGAAAGGGGGGGYCELLVTTIAAPYSYAVGTGGAGGLAGNNPGTTGGASTFGVLTAGGGLGGGGSAAASILTFSAGGGDGGAASGGSLNVPGGAGLQGTILAGGTVWPGQGGASTLSGMALGPSTGSQIGASGKNYGGGGTGANQISNGGAFAGGPGASGLIIVEEYYQ